MFTAASLIVSTILLGAGQGRADDSRSEFLSEHPERLVYRQQGWGELGFNVAAHVRGQPGAPIRIGERKYARGLGHHAPGEIVVELNGEYARFEAAVGVQADCAGGSVVFQVFADDEKRFDSGVLRAGEAARAVSVPLAGAQEMRLVVTDAGDGINCDCADWAEARLIRAMPGGSGSASGTSDGFDVARFARVVASDPLRNEGARSTRVQEYRAEDVFLEWDMPPNEAGEYVVPATKDGAGTIGLRWIERRAIRSLVLEFAGASDAPGAEGARVQFWTGESPYQGRWRQLNGLLTADGPRWTFRVDPGQNPDLRGGTWKVRWILPVGEKPAVVRRLSAFTPARTAVVDLRVQFEASGQTRPIAVETYNAEIVEPAEYAGKIAAKIDTAGAFPLKVRYIRHRSWTADRATIRFALPEGGFAVAIDDVLARHAVYVPAFHAFIAEATANVDLDGYRSSIAGRETILEQVRKMPDQTREQALARVHRVEQDRQPTMLSLACDNHKFIVNRDGVMQFAVLPDPDKPIPPDTHRYPCRITPTFGSGRNEKLSRHLAGGWYPAPVVSVVDGGVAYQMCSFVTPFDGGTARGANPWLDPRPLYVAAFTIGNAGDQPAEASLTLSFLAEAAANLPAEMQIVGDRAVVRMPSSSAQAAKHPVLAVVDASEAAPLKLSDRPGGVILQGRLAARQEVRCRLYVPAWPLKADEQATLVGGETLWNGFTAYWDRVMASAMQVQVPDEFLMDVIRASQVHCLLAARNEEGARRVAAWTASVSYGPLESESHSIIRGMALMGHEEFARRSLDYFIHRYDPAGFLTVGYTLMGTGWHLQTLGEFYELTRNQGWLKANAPKIAKVCEWIMKQREKTKHSPSGLKPLEYGLMPPGVGADWNAFAYHFCLNGYYCAGLREAARALKDIGYEGAEAMLADADVFRQDILRVYRAVQAKMPVYGLRNGTFVPGYPGQLLPGPTGPFFPGEDGNRSWCYDVELGAHHLIPQGVLPADGPDASWIMDHMEDVQFLSDGWFDFPASESQKDPFNLGGFSKVQPYYTRNGEIDAMRDDVKPFVRTYFNTMASLIGLENLCFQEHFHGVGAWNKTHETGYFLQQTRFMLVMERGDELWLGPLVTNNWLRDGMVIGVKNAPTRFGTVSYRIVSSVGKGVIEATIEPPTRSQPKRIVLRLRHPDGKPMQSVMINGEEHRDFDAAKEIIRIEPTEATIRVQAAY